MKVRTFFKVITLILIVCLMSSCFFRTPGSQWLGIMGHAEGGFASFTINLIVVGVSFRLGMPFGLGGYAYGQNGFHKFGITQPIRFLPGIHIQLFPVLSALFKRYSGVGLHILIVGLGIGI